ncbi:MAG: T9SS type A sorting domain-containing protein [Bacteroidales bacterium]|jgi:hypothetical protein
MKTDKKLMEFIEQLKNTSPEIPAKTVKSLIDSGKSSPFVAKRSFQPRRIKRLFNPLKFLVMIAPIVIISSLFLIVNLQNDSKTDTANIANMPEVQIIDSSQFVSKHSSKPVDVFQEVPKNSAETRNELKVDIGTGLLKEKPIGSSGITSVPKDTISTPENAQESESSERNFEQKILRVNINFFKSMGVEVCDDSFSVYTKDTTVSMLDHGSILTMHVFKKSGVTSYDNWTDTIWQPGEEIPTLAAMTNAPGLYSYSFSRDQFFPHFTKGQINHTSIEMCVAVSLNLNDSLSPLYGPVFWYYPNEKFFNCLPVEIAEPLKKEFNYQSWRLDSNFPHHIDGSIRIDGGGLQKDSGDVKKEPVPCVYFTNLCESLPGVDYVNLYPNPATDKLNVDLVLQMAKKVQFRVFDLGGRVISDEGTPENYPEGGQFKHQLDISSLQAGLYLLVMTDDTGAKLTRRFVKN